MNMNAELLNYIYQNTQMGIDTLSQLIKLNDNPEFKEYLSDQIQEYCKINDTAKDLLQSKAYEEKETGTFEKITGYLMLNLKTLTDKSSANMAKMIIQSSNKGIIDTTEKINKYNDIAEEDTIRLLKKLKKSEEESIEKLKHFL